MVQGKKQLNGKPKSVSNSFGLTIVMHHIAEKEDTQDGAYTLM